MKSRVTAKSGTLDSHNELNKRLSNHHSLTELERQFGTSYYIFDVEQLRENYWKIETAFKSRYENFIIGYSYKTNYLPYLCKELSRLGAYSEVVSRLEYDLALKIGENPNRIIFNGPLKTKEDLFFALSQGSMINLDSLYEVEFVKEYAELNRSHIIKLGLRLNFDIAENGVSPLQEGYPISRFGICVESGMFEQVIKELSDYENIKIVGLHGHFSTRRRNIEAYQKITETLCELGKRHLNESLEYIDIGGGIYGELPKSFNLKTPTFDDYASTVCEIMNREFANWPNKPALILEPGISMVANTFKFVAKVIETKMIRGQQFVVVDGSVHNVKPTMHRNNLPMEIIRRNPGSAATHSFHIVGYTCMEKDYLAHELKCELPQINDYIIFDNVGAYTIVFNPPFIKERPSIVAAVDDEFFSVRKQETLKQFFNEEIYIF
ncbi:diaminopimelate decarboxylase [Bacillus sp. DNRA2]|uniref:diaminopimelate decarboxylase n=1 Tax=Bacillus sp. DNRA2 TaxID=2723053 RepID=UPI00145E53E5|nr:diaminopimelate decarboxylase [Bacillus sp. DNRA2]NMD70853.1 diaminopimelate decarboxylase [Bacillus sp. DNRA2]